MAKTKDVIVIDAPFRMYRIIRSPGEAGDDILDPMYLLQYVGPGQHKPDVLYVRKLPIGYRIATKAEVVLYVN